MAGNTIFFRKAAKQEITWRDIFSDVFKKHKSEDGASMFLAGTSLSTPREDQMVSQWKKPWLFSRVGIFALLFIVALYILDVVGGGTYARIPMIFAGALVLPLIVVLLMWEMNIPRNIPIYLILGMIFVGGALSIIFSFLFNRMIPNMKAILAPLTEEPTKLLVICLFVLKPKYRYTLNGVLIGAAVGAGFAAIETMGYTNNYGMQTILARGVLALGAHTVWAALYGGALMLARGRGRLRPRHFVNVRFLLCFAAACLLHFIWNLDVSELLNIKLSFSILGIPPVEAIKYVLLIVAAWIILLYIIKKGVVEVLAFPQAAVAATHPPSLAGDAPQRVPPPVPHPPSLVGDAPLRVPPPVPVPPPMPQPVPAPVPPPVPQSAPVPVPPPVPQSAPVPTGLRGLTGPFAGRLFPLHGDKLALGRDATRCHVVYPTTAPGISSIHCEIVRIGGALRLIDNNSRYGTYLENGTRLTPGKPYPIAPRLKFYLGNKDNLYEIE
ncbi:MAG: PrsW family glutamic-type intramembrane protease [Oscillospiraceae bacterium]|nr:PrsW family glutamic-type intramembrane protease [Oscillospiraceae bacterium]